MDHHHLLLYPVQVKAHVKRNRILIFLAYNCENTTYRVTSLEPALTLFILAARQNPGTPSEGVTELPNWAIELIVPFYPIILTSID